MRRQTIIANKSISTDAGQFAAGQVVAVLESDIALGQLLSLLQFTQHVDVVDASAKPVVDQINTVYATPVVVASADVPTLEQLTVLDPKVVSNLTAGLIAADMPPTVLGALAYLDKYGDFTGMSKIGRATSERIAEALASLQTS